MNSHQFHERLPNGHRPKTKTTAAIWHVVYTYVWEVGETDRYDGVLRKRLREVSGEWFGEEKIKKVLGNMAKAGLLEGHEITAKYTAAGKAMLPFGGLFFHDSPPAGRFIRYSLPGMRPTLKASPE